MVAAARRRDRQVCDISCGEYDRFWSMIFSENRFPLFGIMLWPSQSRGRMSESIVPAADPFGITASGLFNRQRIAR
jgi:hypothetical protein